MSYNPNCPHCGGESYEKMNLGPVVYECEECGERFQQTNTRWLIVRTHPDGDKRVVEFCRKLEEAEADLARYCKGAPTGWKYEIEEDGR